MQSLVLVEANLPTSDVRNVVDSVEEDMEGRQGAEVMGGGEKRSCSQPPMAGKGWTLPTSTFGSPCCSIICNSTEKESSFGKFACFFFLEAGDELR